MTAETATDAVRSIFLTLGFPVQLARCAEERAILKQRHQLFVSMLVTADACAIIIFAALAWVLRSLSIEGYLPLWPLNWESYIRGPLVIFVVPILIACMYGAGLYRPQRDRSVLTEIVNIGKAVSVAMCGVIVTLWAVGNDVIANGGPLGESRASQMLVAKPNSVFLGGYEFDGGRLQLSLLAMFLLLGMSLHRVVIRFVLRAMRRSGRNLRHVAIVGTGRIGQIVGETVDRNPWTGLRVAYFISHIENTERTECRGRPIRGTLYEIDTVLKHHPIDAVYLALPNSAASQMPLILSKLERYSVDVRIVPDVNPRYLPQSMVMHQLDGMPVLSYRESPLAGVGGAVKRAMDVVGSSLCLIVFSPLMLVVAIAVKVSSPGKVIYKQRRVSLGGETFKIYKFRTMVCAGDGASLEPDGPRWTADNDPRITRIGRFLRRTSLDELPQLLNVLKGQMSLVGPRPERPELIDRFRDTWRGYMVRQHVKAGMTGWAQVNGMRGNTSLKKRLQYDLFYIRNWSPLFDVRILLLTVVRGFVHPNAK